MLSINTIHYTYSLTHIYFALFSVLCVLMLLHLLENYRKLLTFFQEILNYFIIDKFIFYIHKFIVQADSK